MGHDRVRVLVVGFGAVAAASRPCRCCLFACVFVLLLVLFFLVAEGDAAVLKPVLKMSV